MKVDSQRMELVGEIPPALPHMQRIQARHRALGRGVELRVAREADGGRGAATFLRELLELSALDHPAFPTVLDRGRYKDRVFYVAPVRPWPALAELVEGDRLGARCRGVVAARLTEAMGAAAAGGVVLAPPHTGHLLWDEAGERVVFRHHRVPAPAEGHAYLRGLPPGRAEAAAAPDPAGNVVAWAALCYWVLSGGEPVLDPIHREPVAIADRCEGFDPDLAGLIDAVLAGPGGRAGEGLRSMVEVRALARLRPDGAWTTHAPAPPDLAGGADVQQTICDLRDKGMVTAFLDQVEGGMEAVRAGLEALDLDELPLPAPAHGAMVVAIVMLALFIGAMLPEGAPPPAPPVEIAGTTVAELEDPPEALARDPWVARLLAVGHVKPADFQRHWGLLRSLALQGRLPPAFRDEARIMGPRRVFPKDPEAACIELERMLAELREVAGVPDPD